MRYMICVMLLLFVGCQALDDAAYHADDVTAVGETTTIVGEALVPTQPHVGVVVLAIGGLIVALGTALGVIKKKP